jgi:hypothetical protein
MTPEQTAELIGKIMKINHQLSDEHFLKSLTGDVLSYIGVKLSAMKASLLDLKVTAHQDMLDKEVMMLKEKGAAFLRAKEAHNATSAGDAKYTDEVFIEAQKTYNEAKVLFEKIRSIVADSHDLIDAIKSRVIDLQGQRKDERLS